MITETIQEQNALKECRKCKLCKERIRSRTKVILGAGPVPADIVAIGMGGGAEEAATGRPFVGPAGKKLNQLLADAGIDPLYVFRTNICLCRPPDNRAPEQDELDACRPFVMQELQRVKPKVVIAAGAEALKYFKGKASISACVGEAFWYNDLQCNIMPIFHPAYLLRKQSEAEETRNIEALRKAAAIAGIGAAVVDKTSQSHTQVRVIKNMDEVRRFFEFLNKRPEVAFDFETDSLDVHTVTSLCIGFSYAEGKATVLPLRGQYAVELWNKKEYAEIVKHLNTWARNDSVKVAANIQFDALCFRKMGIVLKQPWFDVQAAHHLLDENAAHDLDALSWLVGMGGYKKPVYASIAQIKDEKAKESRQRNKQLEVKEKFSRKEVGYDNLPTEVLWPYNGNDADCTLRLKHLFEPQLEEQGLANLSKHLVMPVHQVFAEMKWNGVEVNRKYLSELEKRYEKRMDELEKEILAHPAIQETVHLLEHRALAKLRVKNDEKLAKVVATDKKTGARKAKEIKAPSIEFSTASPIHLRALLFDVLKLRTDKKTKKGNALSTDKDVLASLADSHELPALIDEKRKLAKLCSTYVKGLLESSKHDHRAHTNYNVNGAVSGRISSAGPNLQNIPGELSGRKEEIRNIFIARPGYILLEADYSQAEFRHWANYCQDPIMIDAINRKVDVHVENASLAYGIPIEEVTKQLRTKAKALTFGVMYGRGARSVAKQYKIPEDEAERIRGIILNQYAVAGRWLRDVVLCARKYGYVQTVFGRRRRIAGINSRDNYERAEAERQAVNSPIQGGAGDMTNMAVIRIYKAIHGGVLDPLAPKVWDAEMVLQVHDCIVCEVKKEQAQRFAKEVLVPCMTKPMHSITVPMDVDVKIGNAWGSMEDLKVF